MHPDRSRSASGHNSEHTYSVGLRVSWDRLLTKLEADGLAPRVRGGDQLVALCPAHDDGRNPSLSVRYDPQAGSLLVHCNGQGCATEDIMAALGLTLADLYDVPKEPVERPAPARRRPARKQAGKKKPQRPAAAPAKAASRDRGELAATYVYTSAVGEPVLRVLRYADAEGGKSFSQQRWQNEAWTSGAPPAGRRVLYRLPAVTAAAAAGERVYLVEGEKDADTLIAAGVVATTAPMGAGKWLAHYAGQLAGARVVVVVDRDHLSPKRSEPTWKDAGARHAVTVLDALRGAGVTVEAVVEAAEGKDAADHLAAGHTVAQLVPVDDDALRGRAAAGDARNSESDGGAGGADHRGADLTRVVEAAAVTALSTGRPEYRRGHDCLVRLRRDAGGETSYSLVLEGLARIVRQEQAEVDGDIQTVTLVLAVAADRDSPETEMRVAPDVFQSGAWLPNLPFRSWYRSSRSGIAEVIDAVKQTSDYDTARQHRRLGWIETPTGPAYVHAGGLIDATGTVTGYTNLTGALTGHELPEPPTDPGEVRAAAAHSVGLLEQLPTHLAAALAGLAYRAPLGWTASTLMLRGNPGNYKTALANVAMHHFRPSSRHYDATFSLTSRGHTANSPGELLYRGKDSLLFADDAAPDHTVREASVLLTETLRTQFNRTGKSRLTREGGLKEIHPPAGSLIVASEVGASTQSGKERAFEVGITAGEVSIETMTRLYEPDARHGRAALTASYVRWLAGRLDEAGSRADSLRLQYAARFREQACLDPRPADAAAELAVGWRLMLDHLLDIGAYTPAEADAAWATAWAGLLELGRRQHDADADTGHAERFISLLRSVLRSGSGHLTALDGRCPTGEAPTLTGWTLDPRASRDPLLAATATPAVIPSGSPLGVLIAHDGESLLWLDRNTTLAVVRKLAAATGNNYEQAERAIAEALDEAGMLAVEHRGGRRRRTIRRPGPGGREPGWGLRWAAVWNDPVAGQSAPDSTLPPNSQSRGDQPPDNPPVSEPSPAAPSSPEPPRPDTPEPSPDDAAGGEPAEPPAVAADVSAVRCRTTVAAGDVVRLDSSQPCVVCGVGAAQTLWGVPGHRITCQDAVWDYVLAHTAAPAPAAPPATPEPCEVPGEASGEGLSGPLPPHPGAAEHSPAPGPERGPAARQTPTEAGEARWRAPAAVLDADGVFLPGGEVLPWPAGLADLGGVAALAEQLRLGHGGDRRRLPAQGAVFLTGSAAERLGLGRSGGLDVDERDALRRRAQKVPAVTAARAAGWELGNIDARHPDGQLDGWTRIFRRGGRGMAVGMLPWLPAGVPLFAGDPDPAAIAERLARFADTVGIPYRLTPAATGLDLMSWTRPVGPDPANPIDPEALVVAAELPDIAHEGAVEEDWHWTRPFAELGAERDCRYVHAYDRGGSYPAVTSSLPLGTGELASLTGEQAGAAYGDKRAGYWLVEQWDWPHWGVPDPLGSTPRGRTGGTRWVTTPTLAMLHRHGVEPAILEAHTWARSPRWLSLWNAHVRDARTAAAAGAGPDWAAVAATVKYAANTSIGKLAQQSARGQLMYRPHWRHTIMAKARDVIAYRIEANGALSGRWPVLAATDTITYTSDDPDPATAWPGKPADLGRGFGRWKPTGTGVLAEWGPRWLDGTRLDPTRLAEAVDALTVPEPEPPHEYI